MESSSHRHTAPTLGDGCRPAADEHMETVSATCVLAEADGPAAYEGGVESTTPASFHGREGVPQTPRSVADEEARRPLSAADEGDGGSDRALFGEDLQKWPQRPPSLS